MLQRRQSFRAHPLSLPLLPPPPSPLFVPVKSNHHEPIFFRLELNDGVQSLKFYLIRAVREPSRAFSFPGELSKELFRVAGPCDLRITSAPPIEKPPHGVVGDQYLLVFSKDGAQDSLGSSWDKLTKLDQSYYLYPSIGKRAR